MYPLLICFCLACGAFGWQATPTQAEPAPNTTETLLSRIRQLEEENRSLIGIVTTQKHLIGVQDEMIASLNKYRQDAISFSEFWESMLDSDGRDITALEKAKRAQVVSKIPKKALQNRFRSLRDRLEASLIERTKASKTLQEKLGIPNAIEQRKKWLSPRDEILKPKPKPQNPIQPQPQSARSH